MRLTKDIIELDERNRQEKELILESKVKVDKKV